MHDTLGPGGGQQCVTQTFLTHCINASRSKKSFLTARLQALNGTFLVAHFTFAGM